MLDVAIALVQLDFVFFELEDFKDGVGGPALGVDVVNSAEDAL